MAIVLTTTNASNCAPECSRAVPGLEADALPEPVARRRQQDAHDLQPVAAPAAPRGDAQLAPVRQDGQLVRDHVRVRLEQVIEGRPRCCVCACAKKSLTSSLSQHDVIHPRCVVGQGVHQRETGMGTSPNQLVKSKTGVAAAGAQILGAEWYDRDSVSSTYSCVASDTVQSDRHPV